MIGVIVWALLIFLIAWCITPGLPWILILAGICAVILYLPYSWIKSCSQNKKLRIMIKKTQDIQEEQKRIREEQKQIELTEKAREYCRNYGLVFENLNDDILVLTDPNLRLRITARIALDNRNEMIFKEFINQESI